MDCKDIKIKIDKEVDYPQTVILRYFAVTRYWLNN